jgi:uncharacterized repeat protein (TIGR01451 family)
MKRLFSALIGLSLILGGFQTPALGSAAQPASWQTKVDAWVLNTAAIGQTEFLIFLSEQANLSGAAALETKLEKGAYVYDALLEVARRTQGPVLAELRALGVEHQSFFIANMIWARGDLGIVETLARRADVAHIYANPQITMQAPVERASGPDQPTGIEWNITKVNADDVWAAGYTGQGVVIGGQDTGYDWDHPALIEQYRGWNGSAADHDYNWHDAIHTGNGGVCGLDSPEPCDDLEHGTHTMGTMVGDDGGSNQIGMAPGARWIGCRNMDVGVGTPATYSECYQWFIAPCPVGVLPGDPSCDPAMAPDVINNSWGCPTSEGCNPSSLEDAVQAIRAAGIVTAHSAGNSGSGCGTIDEPAAIYAESFTVGSTTASDSMSGFSSRGPVTVDGSGRRKPDISAPGSNIRSCVPGGGYEGGWSGTSMAAPHVAGLVALLISARPNLAGQVETLETIIEQSAVDISGSVSPQTCGGTPHTQIPNNIFGWGRIDAWAAYQALPPAQTLLLEKTASASQIEPGGILTYTLTITHESTVSTTNVILSDTLPADTAFVSATGPYTLVGDRVRWDYPTLAGGESQTVALVVQVSLAASGVITNSDYGVRSDDIPLTPGEPVGTTVAPFTLGLDKTGPAAIIPGGLMTYTLTVSNPHPFAPQHNLLLTDTLPAGTSFVSATQPHTLAGDTVEWRYASLGPGESQSVELAVQAWITATGAITNAEYAAQSDEVALTTGKPVQTEIIPYSLTLAKSAPATVAPGDLLTYTLTVNNPHPFATTHNLVLTDALPANVAFVAATQPYSLTGGVLTWERADLKAQEAWVVTLTVQTPLTFTGTIVNDSYSVHSDEVQAVSGAPVTTEILGLALHKTASATIIDAGDLLTYTLTVTNQHPATITHNIVLTDRLPTDTSFITATLPYSLNGGVIAWQVASLQPGEVWTATLVVRAAISATQPIVNADYAVSSDEVRPAVTGAPVVTLVRWFTVYLPVIFKLFVH